MMPMPMRGIGIAHSRIAHSQKLTKQNLNTKYGNLLASLAVVAGSLCWRC